MLYSEIMAVCSEIHTKVERCCCWNSLWFGPHSFGVWIKAAMLGLALYQRVALCWRTSWRLAALVKSIYVIVGRERRVGDLSVLLFSVGGCIYSAYREMRVPLLGRNDSSLSGRQRCGVSMHWEPLWWSEFFDSQLSRKAHILGAKMK